MVLTLILVFASLGASLYLLLRKSRVEAFLDEFPGPPSFPLIGNMWILRNAEDRLTKLVNFQQQYGNRVALKGGSVNMLVLYHPDDIAKVLPCRDTNKPWNYDLVFQDWIGSSVFLAKGKDHSTKRRRVLPMFDFKHNSKSEKNFNDHCQTLMNIFRAHASEGKDIQVRWLIPLFAIDIMYQYFTNVDTGFLSRIDNHYATAFHTQLDYGFLRAWSPWLWPEIIWKMTPMGRKERGARKTLTDFMENIVRERKIDLAGVTPGDSPLIEDDQENDFKQREKRCPLDSLIVEACLGQSEITEQYAKDEATAAIFAGHDTVSSAIIFTLYALATHPKEQDKLHLELDEIFSDDKTRNVEFSDFPKLKFLECCIKESLRLYPASSLLGRASHTPLQLDKETIVPKGVVLWVSPWVTQRLPEFWPEPEEFKPSRFFYENCVGRHPYSYIPFAAGPRNCIGQKLAYAVMLTVHAHIFRNFTVELSSTAETFTPRGDAVIFPKEGLKLRLKYR